MRLGHERARRVDDVEALVARLRDDRRVHAVGADDERAVVDLVEARCDLDAALAQRRDGLRVVDERAEGVDALASCRASSASLSARSTP